MRHLASRSRNPTSARFADLPVLTNFREDQCRTIPTKAAEDKAVCHNSVMVLPVKNDLRQSEQASTNCSLNGEHAIVPRCVTGVLLGLSGLGWGTAGRVRCLPLLIGLDVLKNSIY